MGRISFALWRCMCGADHAMSSIRVIDPRGVLSLCRLHFLLQTAKSSLCRLRKKDRRQRIFAVCFFFYRRRSERFAVCVFFGDGKEKTHATDRSHPGRPPLSARAQSTVFASLSPRALDTPTHWPTTHSTRPLSSPLLAHHPPHVKYPLILIRQWRETHAPPATDRSFPATGPSPVLRR